MTGLQCRNFRVGMEMESSAWEETNTNLSRMSAVVLQVNTGKSEKHAVV